MILLRTLRFFILLGLMLPGALFALSFSLPSSHTDVVGYIQKAIVQPGQTIVDISQHYQVGYLEFKEANPGVNLDYLHAGTKLVVPTRYVLPMSPHKGIVINLAELRLYYYPKNKPYVITYPIGIGKVDEPTPILNTKIVEKRIDPIWRPTEKTRAYALTLGVYLPKVVMPGPENPLGPFAMRLGDPLILIHGTNSPPGVGKRSSGGCIRMYNDNVRSLYNLVPIGTPVSIVDQPFKIGWKGDRLYLEAHVPVTHKGRRKHNVEKSVSKVMAPQILKWHVEVNWDKVLRIASRQSGIPNAIGESHKRYKFLAANSS